MLRYALSTLALLPLLLSCATARHDQTPPNPPASRFPVLTAVPKDVLEPAFMPRTLSFLSGKLPEPTRSDPPTSSARPSTK